MKRFSCGDVVPGCAATWVASSDDEILASVARHAADAHGIIEFPPDLVDLVRSRITVPA